jgi:hypothetical protein
LLYLVFDRFTQIDLHPDAISNLEMGYLFEDLIRRFSEISNETAGEHYTPREVIRLIVALLLINDREALTGSGVIRQVYDPAAGYRRHARDRRDGDEGPQRPDTGNTSSASRAAVSAMRRAPQLGQNPRFLQENATMSFEVAFVAAYPEKAVLEATAL